MNIISKNLLPPILLCIVLISFISAVKQSPDKGTFEYIEEQQF